MSNRKFLHLIDTIAMEVPMDAFTNQDGEGLDNLTYVHVGKGRVDLSQLRTACLEQCPDEMAPQVEEWIQHQKDCGGATEDTEIFTANSAVAPILHISFIEDTDGEMEEFQKECQTKAQE